ncbi:glycosyltransferase 87 family protein, partial [Thermodesulfobacteriota bacterium]
FFYDLPNRLMPFGRFFILYTVVFTLYFFAIIKVPKLSADRRNIFIVLAGAFIFRLVLLPGVPIHENDIYRYIWDGKVFNSGINPYKYPPIQASIKPASNEAQKDFETLKSLRDEDPGFYRRVSFKDISTIYPPLTQAVFAVSTLLAPGSVWFMKLLFVLFDIMVIILTYMILKILKQNPLYIIIYAWNPLVLKEFSNSGHHDALAVCLVMAAIYLVLREKYILSSVCLGLGVLSKFYPLVLVPFFLLKKQYKALFAFSVVIIAGYLPFFMWGDIGPVTLFTGLGIYTKEWANNGFIFELIFSLLSTFSSNPLILSKIMCGSIFVIIWLYIFYGMQDFIEKMFWALTALFLLSPVGDPWYFCWVIPFLCIYRKYSMIALSYLLILSYFVFTRDFGVINLKSFKMNTLLLIQCIPFVVFLLFESLFNRFYRKTKINPVSN